MAQRYYRVGKIYIPAFDTAGLADWLASSPLDQEFAHDIDNDRFVYYDQATDTLIPFLEGSGGTPEPKSYKMVARGHTGTNYVSTDLIGADSILLFLMDGLPRYEVDTTPDSGSEYTFDPATGTIDIGTSFEDNDIYLLYKSLTPPTIV